MSETVTSADWLDAKAVADRLGIKLQTVHTYAARGILPPPDHHFGRSPVWRPATIEEYVKTLSAPARARPRTTTEEQP